jgi:hypothetical protein
MSRQIPRALPVNQMRCSPRDHFEPGGREVVAGEDMV